jgi:zinc transporter ZupT
MLNNAIIIAGIVAFFLIEKIVSGHLGHSHDHDHSGDHKHEESKVDNKI